MADIESIIRTKVLADATVSSLIGTRLYYLRAIQDAVYPYVVFSLPSNPSEGYEIGVDGENPIFSFKIVSKTAAEMVAIAKAIRGVLEYTRDSDIYFSKKVGGRDMLDDTDMEDDYFIRINDYEIMYEIS